MRIKFKKYEQRNFLKKVLEVLGCPSLSELRNRGISVDYSTLKNYFNESRTIPEDLFEDLIKISKLNKNDFTFEVLEDNWGKVKGGKSYTK